VKLRPYQENALEAVNKFWQAGGENPLIELATGTGKSLVQAALFERSLTRYPDMRFMSVTHVKELIEQNYRELLGLWPWAPAGIYSAGLGRREAKSQLLFGGIASVHDKAQKIGHVDVLAIDEAHLVPRKAETMYGRFIRDLVAINPDLRVIGLTATPYRLDSGRLDEGEVRMFDEIVYSYGIGDGISDGYLTRLTSKKTETGFDLSGVHRRGGDFIASELQAAVDKTEVTRQAVAEIIERGKGRKTKLIFCAGVEHAHNVRDELRRNGIKAETVIGSMSATERTRIIAAFKAGEIEAVTNNSVMTTGTNIPGIDLLAMMRPTDSTGLYVQMAGRGTRVVYAPGSPLDTCEERLAAIENGPKRNCLVLDFAGNAMRHGPVDAVEPRKPGEGKGEAPVKECPNCHELVHLSARSCPDCGFEFEFIDKAKHTAQAAVVQILSSDKLAPEWVNVNGRTFRHHEKIGGTPSVRTDFLCGFTTHKMWICPQHQGFAKSKADRFWRDHGGELPAPASVSEFLTRQNELRASDQIQIRVSGRYFEVLGVKAKRIEMKEAA
jgi:DNA repair protein RadD